MLDTFSSRIIFYPNILDLHIDFVNGRLPGKKSILKKNLSIYRYIFSIDMAETQKALSPYYIQDYKQHVKKKKPLQMLAIKHDNDLA